MSPRGTLLATIIAVVTFSSAVDMVVSTRPAPDVGNGAEEIGGGDFSGGDFGDEGFGPTFESVPEPTASPGAPQIDWSVEASSISDTPDAGFYDPVTAGELGFRGSGFIEAGDVLVTLVGVGSEYDFELTDSSFVALDRSDGSIRWTTPAAEVSGCASEVVDGRIVCHTGRFSDHAAFVSVDVATGELIRTPTDWYVQMIDSVDDRVYVVEGDIEGNDLRVRSGTAIDPAAYWTSQLTIGGYGEDASMYVLSVDHTVGYIDTSSDAALFDPLTGSVRWQKTNYGDCVDSDAVLSGGIIIVQPLVCEEFEPVSTEALDATGRLLARTDSTTTHRIAIDASAESAPFLLADSAYDRSTGRQLWTNGSLVASNGEGTAAALVGDTALLSNGYDQKIQALDLRSGEEVWSKEGSFAPLARNGIVLAGLDGDGLVALDIESGEGWTLPISLLVSDQEYPGGDETVRASGGRFVFASPAAIVALTPA